MKHYIVKGGNSLSGEVEIAGAKNAALAILAASIMTDEPVTVENVPDVSDIRAILTTIRMIGGIVECLDGHTFRINGAGIDKDAYVENEYVRKIRGSYYFIGALLGKYKKASVVLPGGCNIGLRSIDQHVKGFRALGASVRVSSERVVVRADRLTGSHIYMDVVSVGATINIIMAAVLAEGNTTIENAAKEPHVVDLANFLNSMGARVKGAGTDVIRIMGVKKLHGTTYSIIPDQIEAGTFMFAAAATHGDVTVKNVIPKHLESITAKLKEIGCEIKECDDMVRVVSTGRLGKTDVKTLPYPGFPTDMQPQMTVLLGLSKGISFVTESIFEDRFKYLDQLTRMGANIRKEGSTAIIEGVEQYTGAMLNSPDLRAGAALVIAALAADDFSEVTNIEYIERGYEKFPEKLRKLGAHIAVISTKEEKRKFIEKES